MEIKRYTKTINDKLVIKFANKIVITKDGRNYFSPSEEMILEDGWVEYVKPTPTQEELLIKAKLIKKAIIEKYDSSENVNIFYIQNIPVWLDKATRAGLKLRFDAELALKHETTTLWHNDINFTLPLNTAISMLYAIEVYASQCYDNTQLHIANVNSLNDIEEIENYDHTVGYPEKLNF